MDASAIDLTGQVALVTGGGGIGRAIALCMADMGADVAIIDNIPERCEETAARIRERGRKALTFEYNVMETDKVAEAVAATGERFGRLDILVNNAGGVGRRHFKDLREKNWRRHIDLNLVSNLAATSAAIPIMIACGIGRLDRSSRIGFKSPRMLVGKGGMRPSGGLSGVTGGIGIGNEMPVSWL